jgi:hypothetical protein
VEPLFDKNISWSPYQYGVCNPIRVFDANSLDLFIGGNTDMALNNLKSMFSDVTIQDRSTVDNSGKVNFDFKGLDVSSDAALELLSNMTGSGNKYLYEVSDKTSAISRGEGIYKSGEEVPFNLRTEHTGIENFSVTEKYVGMDIGIKGFLPKQGYSGQVTLGTGSWTIPVEGSTVLQARYNVVFHELAENYFRTEKKQPYERADKSGAHKSACNYAIKFKINTSIKPGEIGRYVP